MAHTASGTYFASLDAQMTHVEYERMQNDMYGEHFAQIAAGKKKIKLNRIKITQIYETEDYRVPFNQCGLQLRDLIGIYDELRQAKKLDPATRYGIDIDDFFEAILSVQNKVQPLEIATVAASIKSIRRTTDRVEKDVHEGFLGLRKLVGDVVNLMGPFQTFDEDAMSK